MTSHFVRPMTADDIPLVIPWMVELPLWRRYGLTAERAAAQFEKALLRQDLLFAVDQGAANRACGFAWCLPEGAFGRSAYLRLIGVRADQAGGGLGSALLNAVEQAASSFSAQLFLLVSDFNLAAQAFYQRHGYQQVGAIPGYVLPDVTEVLYWKQLRQFPQ